ncbi:hypothetical protein [Sphingopyxis sp. MWB1]|uniref:hypothetical protein n=1 Tax=Sphingopyxis sp. MWB1 TaxID=1537715 RepID=UPI00051A8736|nr:hypothetical protein [Sphingopyxis sp. MWB1]
MRDLGPSLRIKYRLEEIPTEEQAREWARQVQNLISEGVQPEEAGRIAAKYLFTINENLILKAEADTIEALLNRAREK